MVFAEKLPYLSFSNNHSDAFVLTQDTPVYDSENRRLDVVSESRFDTLWPIRLSCFRSESTAHLFRVATLRHKPQGDPNGRVRGRRERNLTVAQSWKARSRP